MPTWLEISLALAAFGLGTLGIGSWLRRYIRAGQQAELEELLSKRFASITELNAYRATVDLRVQAIHDHCEATQKMASLAVTNADNALDAVAQMRTMQEGWLSRLASEVIEPLKEFGREQRSMAVQLGAQTALLQRLTQEMDRIATPPPAGPRNPHQTQT